VSAYLEYRSPRARKARANRILSKTAVRVLLWLTVLGGALTGAVAVIVLPYISGFCFAVAIISLLYIQWTRGELARLNEKVDANSQKVDQLLDSAILAGLPEQVSAWAVWKAIEKQPGRYFFANRFGLPGELFENMLSKEVGSDTKVWQKAESLRAQNGATYYTQEIIMASLVASLPDYESLLQRGGLTYADIVLGVRWMSTLEEKRQLAKNNKNYGGIARDWTYGYTPTLEHFGHSISKEIEQYGFFEDTAFHEDTLASMVRYIGNNVTGLVLLGEPGIGKTTTVYAFAERILEAHAPKYVRYQQVVMIDASVIITRANRPGQVEQIVTQLFNEAARAKNIILFFDNAELFFKDDVGSVNIANLLTQVVGGSVRIIFAMTPKDWQELQVSQPQVASKVQALHIAEPDKQHAKEILQNQVIFLEAKHGVLYSYAAIREAYELAKRYEDSLAMPGAALKVLEGAVAYADKKYISSETIRRSLEASRGVKLQTAAAAEATNLLELETQLAKHVVSQKRAIKVIADALRRSRSGVGSNKKPVGTFLFAGPTGVGKTELTKALARVYYRDEASIVRVDMNQFVSPDDVQRLVSAENVGDQLSFLGQVRARPFSVVLLDELEKAHPSVLSLLLQMLDEGFMKDSNNKQVSFADCIIIATSNVGADKVRKMVQDGTVHAVNAAQEFTQHLIETHVFTPEFLNRFDEILLFEPLTEQDLLQVVAIIISQINVTLATKQITIAVDEDAKKWLIKKGYDPALGARSIRRMAQKYIENSIAKKILSGIVSQGATVQLTITDFEAEDA
jgi:ATP-dependent Clp protease ATP-binding subunit ClpC